MKEKCFFLLGFCLAIFCSVAQPPSTFNYQTILRDGSGTSIPNQSVQFKISLLKGSMSGPVSYMETFSTSTNQFGLVNLVIGGGNAISGIIDTLEWTEDIYYMKIEADTTGGENYVNMGTSQVLAVPFASAAKHSNSSVQLTDKDVDTKIMVEENPDEDIIRFYSGGLQTMFVQGNRLVVSSGSENLFIGDSCGANTVTGVGNLIIGAKAGTQNFSGTHNVFIGSYAGKNTDSHYNTFVGTWSGYTNTTGWNNTFIGYNAGYYNSVGMRNTFLGHSAGFGNVDGERNVYVGRAAGAYNPSGYDNVFIGNLAGLNNNGGYNVFIGSGAGQNVSGSNLLVIDNADRPDPLIYGEFDNRHLHFGARYLFIGESNEIVSPQNNVIIGDSAGYTAGHSWTRTSNVYIGNHAAFSDTSGIYNVYLGSGAGWGSTSGYKNTFIGAMAGTSTTTGYENVFVGVSAGWYNTIGSRNTYLGRYAGLNNLEGNNNIFVGWKAGYQEMGSNRLYIANSGTTTPLIYGEFDNALLKFHGQVNVVNHDVYLNDSTKGIILTSPGGQCWRVTIDDAGTLISTLVICP